MDTRFLVRLPGSCGKTHKSAACSQVILDCSEENTAFYSKCGFSRKEVQMALYLPG